MGRALDTEHEEGKGISERQKLRAITGTIDGPTGENWDPCKSLRVLKRRMTWIELSFRKLNLMVHWGERTGSGCVFTDTCLLKKGGYVKEWGNSTRWTMNNGGGVAGREWEKGGVAAGSGERKLIFLLNPLLPTVYILLYNLQDVCWPISNHCLGYS